MSTAFCSARAFNSASFPGIKPSVLALVIEKLLSLMSIAENLEDDNGNADKNQEGCRVRHQDAKWDECFSDEMDLQAK